MIVNVLNDSLGGKRYDANKVSNWSKNIADTVKAQVKTLGYDRSIQKLTENVFEKLSFGIHFWPENK